jgi:hypothetical protein
LEYDPPLPIIVSVKWCALSGTNILCGCYCIGEMRSCFSLDIFSLKIWILPLSSPIHHRSLANFPLLSCPLGGAILRFESISQS